MMQNNFDEEMDQAIALANTARQKRYYIDKQKSIKMKKAQKLSIIKKCRFLLSIGVITICASSFAINLSSKNNSNPIEINTINSSYVVSAINKDETLEQEYIDKYCKIYGLDSNKVYEIAKTLSNSFSDEKYISSNNLIYNMNGKSYSNKELGILIFVRHLYQIPKDFNTNINDIIDKKFTPNNEINEELTVKYYSDLFGVDPSLVLAIEYQESSCNNERYSSDAYLNLNNPAGLIDPATSKLWIFPSKESGIIEHVYQLKNYYIDKGLTTPEQIKEIYAPNDTDNDPTNLNYNWLNNVKSLMAEINANPNIFSNNNSNLTHK